MAMLNNQNVNRKKTSINGEFSARFESQNIHEHPEKTGETKKNMIQPRPL